MSRTYRNIHPRLKQSDLNIVTGYKKLDASSNRMIQKRDGCYSSKDYDRQEEIERLKQKKKKLVDKDIRFYQDRY